MYLHGPTKMKKIFNALAIALLTQFWACASILGPTSEVIERSSEVKPQWLSGSDPGQSSVEIYVVQKRDGLTKLELGIKQVQSAAIQNTTGLMIERMRKSIQSHAKLLESGGSEAEELGLKAIQKVSAKFSPADAVPRALYWENIRRETDDGPITSFNISVLLGIYRSDYIDSLEMVVKELRLNGSTVANKLADELVQENK